MIRFYTHLNAEEIALRVIVANQRLRERYKSNFHREVRGRLRGGRLMLWRSWYCPVAMGQLLERYVCMFYGKVKEADGYTVLRGWAGAHRWIYAAVFLFGVYVPAFHAYEFPSFLLLALPVGVVFLTAFVLLEQALLWTVIRLTKDRLFAYIWDTFECYDVKPAMIKRCIGACKK